MSTWITSDLHYNHKNIVLGSTGWSNPEGVCREFKTLETHNEWLIMEINTRVKQDDVLYHLGDWSFGGFEHIQKFRDRLICKTIHTFIGNHDHHIENNREGVRKLFASVQHYLELPIPGKMKLVMMHYPISSWNGLQKGNPHIYGHQHSGVIREGRSMDVGMDAHGSMKGVYSLEEILDTLMSRSVVNNHHDSKIEVK